VGGSGIGGISENGGGKGNAKAPIFVAIAD